MSKLSGFLFLFLCFLAATKGNIISSWQSDVTEWIIDDLEDGPCKTDLNEYVNALMNLKNQDNLWALQMLDSSAKLPNGLLAFNLNHMGIFEECLAVRHPTGRFQAKHCMVSLDILSAFSQQSTRVLPKVVEVFQPKPLDEPQPGNRQRGLSIALKYGVCVPSTCTASDLIQVSGDFSSKMVADDAHCWTSEQKPLSDLAIAFICVCVVLAALTVISTCYHYLCLHKNSKPKRLLCAFSLKQNVPKLLEIRSNDGDNMGCLHGIRTMSMMWIMLCHAYMHTISVPLINTFELGDVINGPERIIITNGWFPVDSFFFLSGLLVAFVFFRNVGKTGTYDPIASYIHRYIRLTPPLAMMIFATVAILPEIGRGPMWADMIPPEVTSCTESWWKALIYLQNYITRSAQSNTCLGQSWYLSADMQMFWIAPLILYPILLWPTYGIIFLGLLSLASTAWTFALAYVNDYKANMLLITTIDQYNNDYVVTHTRIMPWLVGIACGVGICAIKAHKIPVRLSKLWVLAGWCASTAICSAILFSIHIFKTGPEKPTLDATLYLSLTRPAWGIGLAWIVFACIHGYGGPINSFLSLGVWQPLAKLSYGVFLVHQTVFTYKGATLQTNVLITDFNAVYDFCGNLVLSFLISFVLYITVEAPFMIMDQELFGSVKILQYPKPKPKKAQLEQVEEGTGGNNQESTEKLKL